MALLLIVEDSDTVAPLEIALALLGGLKILVVPNGRDALKLLQADSLDLAAVITDLHLPFLDGFDLVAAIRSDRRYAQVPIIVVSGDGRPETSSRIYELGANAFFTKPYSPAEIRDTIEDLLYAH